jgi:hypothetical protein
LLLSTYHSTDLLSKILPNKEFVVNNANIFIGLLKMLISSILFFVINKTL